MFYRPAEGHGLPHNPFNAIVAPRPIAWVSTRGEKGDNLAPYSFFTAVAHTPPQVVFASNDAKPDRGDTKDTVAQIRESGVFCVNFVESALKDVMNESCRPLPAGQDEFTFAGIEKAECSDIDCPRVAQAPASFECRLVRVIDLLAPSSFLIHGEVTGIHLRPDCIKDGRYHPRDWLSRLGYFDYATVTDTFVMPRPGED